MWAGVPVLMLPQHGLGVSWLGASWGHVGGTASVSEAQSGGLSVGRQAGAAQMVQLRIGDVRVG